MVSLPAGAGHALFDPFLAQLVPSFSHGNKFRALLTKVQTSILCQSISLN
jgi:hypothetical protein